MKNVNGAFLIAVSLTLFLSVAAAQDTVRIAQGLAHSSLNPAEATGLADATVIRVMFEGLVGFDENFDLVPELATRWEVNDDATEFTFQLREGVTFHDGTPFDAQAAKDYYDWVLDPDSVGSRGRNLLADVTAVEVVEPYTLRITLERPNGALLFNLALSQSRIASPASIEEHGNEVGRFPVGTGPFSFVDWEDGQRVVVEAFGDYWGETAHVERLEFMVVTNAATRVAMLQSGEADFVEDLPPQLINVIEAEASLDVIAVESTFARILQLNTQRAPFDDVRVRQALNYAVDTEQLVNVVWRGFATPLTSVMPEPVFGHVVQEPYSYNPERARELLAEAGYADGFTMTVLTFTGDEYRSAGQVLQQMFSQVGVTLELNPTERGALVEQIFLPLEENPTEASLVGASTATGDADRALTVSFSRSSWPPSANNWSFYDNPEVDALIRAGVETGDPEMRLDIYAEAQEIVWRDAPWVFLYSPNNIAAQVAGLTGVTYLPEKSIDARFARFE